MASGAVQWAGISAPWPETSQGDRPTTLLTVPTPRPPLPWSTMPSSGLHRLPPGPPPRTPNGSGNCWYFASSLLINSILLSTASMNLVKLNSSHVVSPPTTLRGLGPRLKILNRTYGTAHSPGPSTFPGLTSCPSSRHTRGSLSTYSVWFIPQDLGTSLPAYTSVSIIRPVCPSLQPTSSLRAGTVHPGDGFTSGFSTEITDPGSHGAPRHAWLSLPHVLFLL